MPGAWFLHHSTHLLKLEFVGYVADASQFILSTIEFFMMLLIYIDDNILTRTSNVPSFDMLAYLNKEFSIKDLGTLHYFLCIQVHHTSDGLLLT